MARKLKLKCPICKKPVTSKDAEFPFCSDRCRLIDLGKWASGAYVISSPVQDTGEGIEDLPRESDEDSLRAGPARSALGHAGRDVLRNRTSAARTRHLGLGGDRPSVVASRSQDHAGLAALGSGAACARRRSDRNPCCHSSGAGQRSKRPAVCGDR